MRAGVPEETDLDHVQSHGCHDTIIVGLKMQFDEISLNGVDQFLQRIRGGVQLQYVNSIYREGDEPMTADSWLMIQVICNILLRKGGRAHQHVIDRGGKKYRIDIGD